MRANCPSPAVPADALRSGSLAISRSSTSPTASSVFSPVSSVLSAMHRGDLLLLSALRIRSQFATGPASSSRLRSLPVNPYPVHPGTPIRAHFVADKPPTGTDRKSWTPWVGGTWRKWIKGTVVGYRDYAGREAKVRFLSAFVHGFEECDANKRSWMTILHACYICGDAAPHLLARDLRFSGAPAL